MEETYEEHEVLTCDACGGPLGLLGTLGRMQHFECRDCGLPHHRILPEPDPFETYGTEEHEWLLRQEEHA